jgi:inosine/xanthosine triphosphatase
MPKTVIAIGSKRGPKINGVKQALEFLSPSFPPAKEFELVGLEVDSGVGHTPLSHEELMRGARHRAEMLIEIARKNGLEWHYFIGLEGGLEVIHETASPLPTGRHSDFPHGSRRRVFLESWAYVTDGGRGHYGRSGGIELPEPLARDVLENGTELAVAIDRFAGMVGIRDAQGAWGVLSGDLISRQEAFRLAVIAAFAPFYNQRMYRAGAVSPSGAAL